ncbi:MAG: aromatic amino acid lyase, partial [Anaerolineae bacterium]|nr:aromatic amino acid lyase [Phycisphaerae bacterium]
MAEHSNSVELTGESLTIEQVTRIARIPAITVSISEAALARVRKCREHIERIVKEYHDSLANPSGRITHVYGVTTGFGEFKDEPVPPEQLVELQQNILLSHSSGAGDSVDENDPANYFSNEVVRAALVIRLNTLIKGFSGVRVEVVNYIAAMINKGVVPLVPTRGSVGSSGDLCPLAHLFVVMLGEGRFRLGNDLREAKELPKVLNLAPVAPSYKEGLALTNGATFSAAQLALAVHDAEVLAGVADVATAMAIEAICGRTRAYDEAIHDARNMAGQRDSAANIRALLSGSQMSDRAKSLQDAYSIRCSPQVHGASRDTIAYAKMVVLAEINAATDNPLFFPELNRRPFDVQSRLDRGDDPNELGDERAFSAGNFHGQPIALAADFLAIAVAELANIAERRTQLLLDKNHNRNLPANLIAKRGVNSGLMLSQYCAAGLVSENKVLTHPASVDSIPTSANSEDHNAMASIAARKLRTVVSNCQAVLAINLLAATQAIDWRIGMNISPSAPTISRNEVGAVIDKLEAAEDEARRFAEAM